eukprot:scpid97427/ scgid1620/ Protein kinase C-binding protein 1; Cutaneous T-cell lymphoma-associated antigen se14-3; Rack7; Zinc finger MYND domain-containing protein 8
MKLRVATNLNVLRSVCYVLYDASAPAQTVGSSSGGVRLTALRAGQGMDADNDNYCWQCHKEGQVICCDGCPRVFHLKCAQLPAEPEGDWLCPVCREVKSAVKVDHNSVKEMYYFILDQMETCQGANVFTMPVSVEIFKDYPKYIFHPVSLDSLREKLRSLSGAVFQNPREFLQETKWIIHNCIIYNGEGHKLTTMARNMVRFCRDQVVLLELCPPCFAHMTRLNSSARSYCTPNPNCTKGHKLVWAKLRGYPIWPAKVMKSSKSPEGEKYEVMFFGDHSQ